MDPISTSNSISIDLQKYQNDPVFIKDFPETFLLHNSSYVLVPVWLSQPVALLSAVTFLVLVQPLQLKVRYQ